MNKTTLNSTSFDPTPYEWKEGDLITSEKLNALENLKTAYSEQASKIEEMTNQIEGSTVKLNTLTYLNYYPLSVDPGDLQTFYVPHRGSLGLTLEEASYEFRIHYFIYPGLVGYRRGILRKGENGVYSGSVEGTDSSYSRFMGVISIDSQNPLKLTRTKGHGAFISSESRILGISIHSDSDSPLFSDEEILYEVCFMRPYGLAEDITLLQARGSDQFKYWINESMDIVQFTSFPDCPSAFPV